MTRRDDEALFGYAVGPQSYKKFQLPSSVTLWRARVEENGALTEVDEPSEEPPRFAFLGARSCELHAMGILGQRAHRRSPPDPGDEARVRDVFIIAVQCGQAGGTCFCVSMNTGPVARTGSISR